MHRRLLALAALLAFGCGSENPSPFAVSDGGTDVSVTPDAAVDTGPVEYTDFPTPIVDGTAPANAAGLFGGATAASAGGPCLVEPETTAIFPKNWLRPRFHWVAPQGANLYELRLKVANQKSDLVVYTTNTSWTMPSPLWTALTLHSVDVAMTVSIRSGTLTGSTLESVADGSSGPLRIAPVEAPGSIVYWSTTSKSLKGFRIGEEVVVDVLKPAQFKERGIDCVGCHSSSPDGDFVGFTTKIESPFDPSTEYAGGISPLDKQTAGTTPSWVGNGAKQALAQPYRGTLAFSAAHWKPGDRRVIVQSGTANNTQTGALQWIDLEAPQLSGATGILARNGDVGVPVAPSWSHDGTKIAYVSAKSLVDSRADKPPIDLYTVGYAGGAGGAATKLPGASDAAFDEHYPAFSPDDAWLAFVRTPTNANTPAVFDPAKEVYVIPASGGTPQRLSGNDPPACATTKSPGAYNSFPKWAPGVTKVDGLSYYWLVFSSKRIANANAQKTTQLFLVAVVIDGAGAVKPAGAIRLWNLPEDEDNHTPAWDLFKTPGPN